MKLSRHLVLLLLKFQETSEISEDCTNDSVEKVKDTEVAISKLSDVHASLKLLSANDHVSSCPEDPNLDLQPLKNNGEVDDSHGTYKWLSPKDHHIVNENLNSGKRRASFPPNIKHQKNGFMANQKFPAI